MELNQTFFFMGLEWERDAGATLGPSIYFSVGVWECWSRLNTLALTKQPKINTVDWGYNNTQQPLLLSGSQPLCDAFRTTHKNQDTEEEGEQEKGGVFLHRSTWLEFVSICVLPYYHNIFLIS